MACRLPVLFALTCSSGQLEYDFVALTDLDRNLLRRCLTEEPGAWKDLVDRYIGLFIHVVRHTAHARSIPTSPEDTDDLVAEVFAALCVNDYAVLRSFRGKSSLATYLTVIARRICVRQMAQKRMAEAMGHVTAHQASLDKADAVVEFSRLENREEVKHLLSGLPERDAKIVRAFHLEGKSYREISQVMGVPENSIGPTLNRALTRIRERKVRSN
jgi:RNA polymerase sigma-70 factor (ECF subfamily)